jgi:hypothetical protein
MSSDVAMIEALRLEVNRLQRELDQVPILPKVTNIGLHIGLTKQLVKHVILLFKFLQIISCTI